MARVRMVTRTINATVCTVLCMNEQTKETIVETVKIGGIYKDDKSLMKAVSKAYDVEGEKKALYVTATENEEVLYGMPESEFLKVAKVLPPRSKEEVETEEV